MGVTPGQQWPMNLWLFEKEWCFFPDVICTLKGGQCALCNRLGPVWLCPVQVSVRNPSTSLASHPCCFQVRALCSQLAAALQEDAAASAQTR